MIKVDVLENGSLLILERTVSDSVKFEKIRFSFPESWKDLTKTAVFKNGDTAVEILLNSGSDYCTGKDECFVPFEVIKPPFFTVSVFGGRGDTLATTVRGEIEVLESGYELGDNPQEPTQSIYAQILDETKKATQIAQSVRDDADNGKFKGEKGDKGEAGNGGVVDLVYNPKSENPQSGKAVAEAISGIEFSGGDVIEIDQIFNPQSENAQSGKAVAEALRNQIEMDVLIESLKEQNNGDQFTFWVGTQAEYDAIEEKARGCFYIITDDNSRNEIVDEVLNSQKDYIVEQGISGIWTYRKWASGIAECWGRHHTIQPWDGDSTIALLNMELPFAFVGYPILTCSGHQQRTATSYIALATATDTLVSGYMKCMNPINEEYSCWFNFQVMGRWK